MSPSSTSDLGTQGWNVGLRRKTLDSLRWQMSRFTGYVAVVNDFGGKFMADRQNMRTPF